MTLRPSPTLLDLGPAVGSNVTFFGELGCKILVEDLFSDIEGPCRESDVVALGNFFRRRLPYGDESVDAILCWDLLDYLERPAAEVLAGELTRVLRVGGSLLGFFGTIASQDSGFTKYIIVDEENLRHRPYAGASRRRHVLPNRDIIRLFPKLRVADSFLLKTNLREVLFRKPAYLSAVTGR